MLTDAEGRFELRTIIPADRPHKGHLGPSSLKPSRQQITPYAKCPPRGAGETDAEEIITAWVGLSE